MGFLEDATARRRENDPREIRHAPAREPHPLLPQFRDLATLCKQYKVRSLKLVTFIGEQPAPIGARGWALEVRPDRYMAFDENGRVWERAEFFGALHTKYKIPDRVNRIAIFEPRLEDSPMRTTRGFETIHIDLGEVAVAAGAEVLAGRATTGLIPLNAAIRRRQREEYGDNA